MEYEVVYNRSGHSILHYPKLNLIEDIWKGKSFTQRQYQNGMLKYANMVEKHHTSRVLINLLEFKYTISPEIQVWVDENVISRTSKIVKIAAFLLPSELISRMSVEQLNDEEASREVEDIIRYFSTHQEAMDFLSQWKV